ncbi:MAG TPA: GGDEF domain-containing protein, partial [Solirubrobacteraceae bacterium]
MVEGSTIRRITIVMYGGAIFGLLCAIFGPDPDPSDHTAFAVIIGLAVVALATFVAHRSWGIGLVRAGGFYGVAITCLCAAVARPTNGVPLYTIWPLLISAYALPRRDFAVLLGATFAGLAVAIGGFVDPPARLNLWLDTTLTVGFAALVVRMLREKLDALVAGLRGVAEQLDETARRDSLTSLPNRRAFDEALRRELDRGERTGQEVSLVLFDLDHFKLVNDRHGHGVGDESLRLFAEVARAELGPGDVLGRIGGEEFGLVLFGSGAPAARAVAERVIAALRGASAGRAAPLSASAGVVERTPLRATADELLGAGDQALYAAKAAGRARVAVAGERPTVGTEVAPAAARALPARPPAPATAVAVAVDSSEGPAATAPSGDERGLMQRVAVYQCLAGIVAMACSALLPGITAADEAAIVGLCAALAVEAAIMLAIRDLPAWVFKAMTVAGVLVIGAAVAINDPISGTPFFYLWPAVFSAYFLGRRHLWLVLALTAGTYAGVLALWVDAPLKTSDFTTVMAPVAIAALVVAALQDKVRALVAQLGAKLEELREAASHDALTGLLNRRAFDRVLAREVERAHDSGLDLALVLLDVDHFKRVNDRFGHAAGDAALRTVAEVMAGGVRSVDVVARLGGEEFAVVLLGATADEAARLADELAAALAHRTAPGPSPLSVSAGVAVAGGALRTPDQLLVAADRALYAAKR